MKIYKPILVIIILILSVSAVAAADTNVTTHDTLDLSNADVLSADEKTYTDLFNEIYKANNTITLQNDYTFNKETDNRKIMTFENIEFTIDGNNHRIDGKDIASAFNISKSDILIKNLVFTNCIEPLQIYNSKVTTVNVTFLNSPANETLGGVVYAENSDYYSQNDKFINNYATQKGDAIYGYYSKINVYNSEFSNEKSGAWSMIYGTGSLLNITSCTFANTTSKYAPAIYNNRDTLISKSKFINLSSNLTAGAIAIKGEKFNTTTKIEDCEFINVKSTNNGGAAFIDAIGAFDTTGTTSIANSKFINCSSGFGGAVLQLGGNLDISNTEFTNNYATENGGAVYTSYTTLNIKDSTFSDNMGSIGSAVYFDENEISIEKSAFKNNYALDTVYGGAITVYDSIYSISDTTFENNTENDVTSYYENKKSSITSSGNVKTSLNNIDDSYRIRTNGNQITLNPLKINGSPSDSYFNLKDLGLVTPVKDQGAMSSCWAFGTAGAFESAYLIATNTTLDISENYIRNLELQYSNYGIRTATEYGNYNEGAANILDWFGAINTEDDVYDELGKISSLKFTKNAYHAYNAIYIQMTDKNALKEALTTYGGLSFYVRGVQNDEAYYNPKTSALYVDNEKDLADHYVTLVGWDDSYSKDNFNIKPKGDGAWICKNSWGTNWGDNGYFYISYYDKSINRPDIDALGFVINNPNNYDVLYQNSVGSFSILNSNYKEYQTTFTAANDAIISAVGTYFLKENTPYTISVYLDNVKLYSQSGKSKFSGFETVELNEKIAIPYNSTFSIRIKSDSVPFLYFKDTRLKAETPDYIVDTYTLKELTDSFTPIKAYTFNNNINLTTKNIIRYYSNTEKVIFPIIGPDGANVTVNFNGKNQTVTLKNGSCEIDLGILKPGSYPVKIYYNNQSITNYAAIKSTIETGLTTTTITITTNTKCTLTVTFYNPDGTLLKNTPVTLIIAGVKYNTKTDENGTVQPYYNPGNNRATKYIDLTNPANGENLRVTIKVISRFAGNKNVNMYYYDGSTYKVRVRDNFGKYVGAGQAVTIKIGKKTYKVKTDKNGWAKLKIPKTITPGKYTIKATYKKQTISNKLTVKQVLKTSKTVKVKKSAKKLTLKATLKKSKTPMKNKAVKFKVNGKVYKTKTNSKGIAKVTLKKSAINKLKSGKNYTIKVYYLNNAVKSTLKVRN